MKKNNNHNRLKVVLAGAGKDIKPAYAAESRKVYRYDVTTPEGRNKGLGLCGFESYLEQEGIAKGTYEIALCIGKKIVRTGKTVVID